MVSTSRPPRTRRKCSAGGSACHDRQRRRSIRFRECLQRGVAAPSQVLLSLLPPVAGGVRGGSAGGEALDRLLSLPPGQFEARRGHCVAPHTLDERKRPGVQIAKFQ